LQSLTYVDRIDTSKILSCPHGATVTRKQKFGVTIFYHPDGAPCTLLNSLQLDGDTLNAEDIVLNEALTQPGSALGWFDNPRIYSRLAADIRLIKRLAAELDAMNSKKDAHRLEAAILKIARGKNAVDIFRAIATILPKRLVFHNVTAVYMKNILHIQDAEQQDLNHLYPIVAENIQTGLEERLKQLKNERGPGVKTGGGDEEE